jgi:hypothetical protein
MSFLKKLFGVEKPDKYEYTRAMIEMATESERTHRGMINTYNSEVELGLLSAPLTSVASVPTGRGVYKARLYAALFMVYAYAKSGHPETEVTEMLNVATGIALEPLVGGEEPHLDRKEAESFTTSYLIPTLKAIPAAFEAGPMVPGQLVKEHTTLADQLHDALAESIGIAAYTPEVRYRFAHLVQGNVASTMAHASKWVVR